MLDFISENLSSIIVGAVVLAILVLIIVKMIRGGSSNFCSYGDCSGCSNCGVCKLKTDEKKEDDTQQEDDTKPTE